MVPMQGARFSGNVWQVEYWFSQKIEAVDYQEPSSAVKVCT